MDITDLVNAVTAGFDDFDNLDTPRTRAPRNARTTPKATAEPIVVNLADIPAQPVTWLWPGWIPNGTLSILGGHIGDGKSTIVAAITAAITNGSALPDGTTTEPANVLFLSTEDDPARVIRPRLAANNANLDRVYITDAAAHAGPIAPARIDLFRHADHLRQLIEAHDIRLIVIDPVSSLLPGSDRASEGTIRDSLRPLMDLMSATGVAVLGVMRVGKTLRNHRPAQRLIGSSAFPAIARSVLMLANVPASAESDDFAAGQAMLEVVKSNYSRAPKPVTLSIAGNGEVHWLGPASTGIDEISEDTTDRRLSRSEREDAADFLKEYLQEKDEWAKNVLYQAKELGFSEITIRRAKKDLGITSYRDPNLGGSWMWRLPKPQKKATRPKPSPRK